MRLFKRSQSKERRAARCAPAAEPVTARATESDPQSDREPVLERPPAPPARRLFGRLRNALARTRAGLVDGIAGLFSGSRKIDESLLDELEMLLLAADVGVEATERLLAGLRLRLKGSELDDARAVLDALKAGMVEILSPVAVPLTVAPGRKRPFVILMVGINGAGKTTTIAKLSQRFLAQGLKVMLAAGDTFRAAAIDQLQIWGERHDVPVIAQQPGADAASVAYDGLQSAMAKGTDILIVDTAGRLHTQVGLMNELAKIQRVLGKLNPDAPDEVLLVLDGGTGQNALVQARQFKEAVGVSGIVVTKLDGTAKGGVLFSVAEQYRLPIRFIGVGETAEDLRVFDAGEFVEALLSDSPEAPA